MSDFVSRLPRTEFGAPILSDYGQDDLSRYRDDVAVATLEPVRGTRVGTLVAIEFDLDAPAKKRRTAPGDTLREPDFIEDGQAYWIGEDGVVGVDLALLHRFADHLADSDRFALRAYRVRAFESGEPIPSLNAIYRTCCG